MYMYIYACSVAQWIFKERAAEFFSLFFSLFNVVNWSNPTFWHIWELDVWAQSPGPNYTVTSLVFYKKKKSVNLIYALYCLCFNHIIFYHSLFWPKTGLKMSWNALMDLTGWDACHVFVTLWLWFLQYNLFCMSSFQLTFLVKISSVHWLVTSCIRMFVWCSGFLTRLLILKTVLCHYTRWHRFMLSVTTFTTTPH